MALQITLAVTIFMMIMFIWHKVPFGVTTMTCCCLLMITGVVPLNTAFSGFSNKIVILIAPMLALSAVLSKTSLVTKLSGTLNTLKGKNGLALILMFYAVGIIFAQFIPTTGAIAILVVFLATLGNTGEITTNRLMLPLLGVMVAWKFRTPIGLGATTFATLNAMYEGIISNPDYMLTMLDPFIFALIPGTCLSMSPEFIAKDTVSHLSPELPHIFIRDCLDLAENWKVDICLPSHLNQGNVKPNIPRDRTDYHVWIDRDIWGDVLRNRAEAVKQMYPEVYSK